MSDTDGKKTLGLRGGARPGNVKQSFSHGRTKNVVVETKRKRVVVPKTGAAKGGTSNPSLGDPAKRPAGITDAEFRPPGRARSKRPPHGKRKKKHAPKIASVAAPSRKPKSKKSASARKA